MKISPEKYLAKLPLPATEKWPEGVFDIEAMQHGSMSLILFAPRGNDYQTPHEQDELYIILEGEGILDVKGKPFPFKPGDALFVAAGEAHRFIEFSHGTKMWAIFWGPKGGE
ncbi:MAG: cupin domain-containing protein [Agarilytica sp.]